MNKDFICTCGHAQIDHTKSSDFCYMCHIHYSYLKAFHSFKADNLRYLESLV